MTRSRRIALAALIAPALVVGALSCSPANASVSTQLQTAQDTLANCQLLAASSNGTQRARARDCVTDQTAIIALLGAQVTPSTSAPAETTPPATPSPTAEPTTTPTPTVTPTASPSPSPTPTEPPPTSFDPAWWEANAGLPPFGLLTTYTGPCTITTPLTVIADSDTRSHCPNGIVVQTTGVLIQRSMMLGLYSDTSTSTVRAEQSDIDGGQDASYPAVAYRGITLDRVNVHGGQHSLQCSARCTAIDSWFHDTWLPDSSPSHQNGIISNGGGPGLFVHNRIECNHPGGNSAGGGCSGDASLYGDFGVISGWTFDENLFVTTGGSYCTYAGNNPGKQHPVADHIVYTDNVFQQAFATNNGHDPTSPGCAYYGPVTGFPGTSSVGNVWSGNVWDTGGAVSPA